MEDGLPIRRRLVAILALGFGTSLAVIDGTIVNVALPTIARDLKTDNASAVLVVTVYQLVLVMSLLPMAALGQYIGLRKVYQSGQVLFVVATMLCFFANSLPYLLIVRAFQALGAATVLSMSTALLRSVYPSAQLGRGLAVNSVIVSVSSALAPTLGGGILALADWPWVFAAPVPFGLLSLALGRALPKVPGHGESFDILAAVMCALTMGLVITGLEGSIHGDSPVVSIFLVLVGVVIGVIFVRRELREPQPIMPLDLLAKPVLALSALGSFIAFMVQMTVLVWLPFRLQHGYEFSPAQVGAMLAAAPMTTMIAGPVAGILSDKYHAGILGGIGMTVAIAGLLALSSLPPEPHYFDIAWRMALFGAGMGLFMPPNARMIIRHAPDHRTAAAGGLISTVRLTGQTIGATLAAALLAIGLGDGGTPAIIAACLALMAGFASVARLKTAKITR
ncbi:MAG: MFS transporter [Sphingobium sp.]